MDTLEVKVPAPLKIEDILMETMRLKASDIHLIANEPPIFRIDGVICRSDKFPVLSALVISSLINSILNEEQKKTFLGKKELDLSCELSKIARFRVNLFWEKGNISMVARLISGILPTMEEIMLPPIVYELTKLNSGLIIITGPAGCGKSTTLAAFLNYINQTRPLNIVTLEDPVEYIFTPDKSAIVQRELGRDMLSFKEGLKHVLRQDPNVIMVGEMRDLETVALALTLAETGHLVLATLHTPDAPQTVDRILDVFPSHQQSQIRFQLSLVLRAIIAQRLLPKINGGRIAAREILLNNSAVASLIRDAKTPQIRSVIQTHAKEGMITMFNSIRQLYKAGLISQEVALAQVSNPDEMSEMIRS
ncbi:MAG: type IV pilus twitching motility protein PilT [Patescibacteria group bacterium]